MTPAPTYIWNMLDKFLREWKKHYILGETYLIPKHICKNILCTPQIAEIVKYLLLLLHFLKDEFFKG